MDNTNTNDPVSQQPLSQGAAQPVGSVVNPSQQIPQESVFQAPQVQPIDSNPSLSSSPPQSFVQPAQDSPVGIPSVEPQIQPQIVSPMAQVQQQFSQSQAVPQQAFEQPLPEQQIPQPIQQTPPTQEVSQMPIVQGSDIQQVPQSQPPQAIQPEYPILQEPERQVQPTQVPQVHEEIPEQSSDEVTQEPRRNFFPKPLRILLGVLVLFLIVFLGIKIVSGLLSPANSGKVTLEYWGLWEDSNVMQGVIADFERQNPNITVNYVKEDPKQYSQRLLTRAQAGTGPDIFRYHVSWIPMLSQILSPLPKDVISQSDLSEYFPVISHDLVKNGALYGVPLQIDTLSLYVNKTIFDKAKATVPTTWDNFITVSRALTQKDESGKIKIAGAAIGTYDNITHAPDILSLLLLQNGVTLTSMTPGENAADALTFYTTFTQDQSNVWDSTLDMSQLAFARGEVAMYFGFSWDIFLIKAANPDLDFAIYPVPHLPGRNNTIASYWVEGVSSKSKHQKEADLFMKYLAQKNTLTKLYTEEAKTRQFGELYPRRDLAEGLKSNQLIAPFITQASDASSSFFAGETFDSGINAQMNGYLGNAVRSVLGNTSAQSAVQTLSQGVSQVLKQYGQTQ